jgi:hypothetical protein
LVAAIRYSGIIIIAKFSKLFALLENNDCLCGIVVRVLGYRSRGPSSIPGTTRKKSSGSGTEYTQPREELLDRKVAAPV